MSDEEKMIYLQFYNEIEFWFWHLILLKMKIKWYYIIIYIIEVLSDAENIKRQNLEYRQQKYWLLLTWISGLYTCYWLLPEFSGYGPDMNSDTDSDKVVFSTTNTDQGNNEAKPWNHSRRIRVTAN